MKKSASVLLICTLFFLSVGLMAKDSRGVMLIVHQKNGHQIKGELIAVKRNSLLLLDSESGRDVSVPNNSINVFEKGALKGAVIGFLVGAGAGLALSAVWNSSASDNDDDSFFNFDFDISPWLSALCLGAAGAVIGAAIGAKSDDSDIIILEGKSQEEKNAIFERLRSEARVPHFR